MKTILITIALLIGLSVQGQRARLDSWYSVKASTGNIDDIGEYIYDSTDNLKYIIRSYGGFDGPYFTYSNDTLIEHKYNDVITIYYVYLNDTVIQWNWEEGDSVGSYFTMNDYNAVIKYFDKDYIWHEGNMVETYSNGQSYYIRTYNLDYINPWHEETKYFRREGIVEERAGSYNVMDTHYYSNGTILSLKVIESIGVFPTIIEYYNGEALSRTYYFTYYDFISDTPEIPKKDPTVLSLHYYDLMGRKISKPTQGFYIERKTTDKGIVSTKYFIQ